MTESTARLRDNLLGSRAFVVKSACCLSVVQPLNLITNPIVLHELMGNSWEHRARRVWDACQIHSACFAQREQRENSFLHMQQDGPIGQILILHAALGHHCLDDSYFVFDVSVAVPSFICRKNYFKASGKNKKSAIGVRAKMRR